MGTRVIGAGSKHTELGLTDYEYEQICEKLRREPNDVELAVFSLMWSEHCGYKHSKKLLRRLPTEGPHLLLGPGENAGAVDVGDGLAIAFKVESHNHPSAVEPFEGAATGVGGILRDIFAVGARPIAVLDSLRFGELDSARSRYLLDRVVAGIGHYGNSVGVATVGGEIYFEGPYEQNCLVNAMCLGIAPHERLTRSAAAGVGNHVVLLGALTGRDGIGGASVLASAELGDGDEAKRPSVQIGDPFEEKKLIECCLELLDRDLLASLQDLGAAGLTSSSSEMASKGQVGIDLDMAEVPLREADMEPFEIMISESQERMLCVVEPQLLDAVFEVCQRWEVRATAIGTVTDGNRLRVFDGDDLVGEMPVDVLVDGCPLYDLEPEKPAGAVYTAPPARIGDADNVLLALLRSPSIASKLWAFEQYDPLVGSRTVRRPAQAEAAVLHLLHDGGHGAVAVSIEGNGRRVACDPYVGAAEAVLECAANLACVGAEPLGLTNCLNFGNPEKPPIAWQLTRAVDGLADACRALNTPVVGGNVSLYNEAPKGPIYPTPVVGMVGKLPDPAVAPINSFPRERLVVVLAGSFEPALAGSELEKLRGELSDGLPAVDLGLHAQTLAVIRAATRSGLVVAAHDIAEGGLGVALAEMAIPARVGVRADLRSLENGSTKAGGSIAADSAAPDFPAASAARDFPAASAADSRARSAAGPSAASASEALLFGEGAGGFLLACAPDDFDSLAAICADIPFTVIGETGGNEIVLQLRTASLSLQVEEAAQAYERAVPSSFE